MPIGRAMFLAHTRCDQFLNAKEPIAEALIASLIFNALQPTTLNALPISVLLDSKCVDLPTFCADSLLRNKGCFYCKYCIFENTNYFA